MANSRSRDAARASSRLAMFTHAISSTSPTAARSSHKVDPTFPTSSCCSGRARISTPAFVLGYSCARRRATTSSSACAWASVAPGRSRASDVDEARLPVLHPRGGVLAERRADIDASRELESFRCDADDGVRLSVEDEPLADGVEPAAETALPQAMADDCDGRGASPIVVAAERAPVRNRHAEQRKEVGRDLAAVDCTRGRRER